MSNRSPWQEARFLKALCATNGGPVSVELLRELIWIRNPPFTWFDQIRIMAGYLRRDGHPVYPCRSDGVTFYWLIAQTDIQAAA